MHAMQKRKRPKMLALSLIASTLILTSCESLTALRDRLKPKAEVGFCRIAKPISWADEDTDQTIKEVKAHNAVGVKLCKWEGG